MVHHILIQIFTNFNIRWIKFEETVERGGDRWSRPHVGSLSLHYIYEFRELLKTCVVLLDLKADSLVKFSSSICTY